MELIVIGGERFRRRLSLIAVEGKQRLTEGVGLK